MALSAALVTLSTMSKKHTTGMVSMCLSVKLEWMCGGLLLPIRCSHCDIVGIWPAATLASSLLGVWI
jgi:hypothetical protein